MDNIPKLMSFILFLVFSSPGIVRSYDLWFSVTSTIYGILNHVCNSTIILSLTMSISAHFYQYITITHVIQFYGSYHMFLFTS